MWVMHIEETRLKEFCSKHQCEPRLTLTIRVTALRDATPGISLAIGDEVIGEWTDSKANLLTITKDYQVSVCEQQDKISYLIAVPGAISGEQLSDTEVTISAQLQDTATSL